MMSQILRTATQGVIGLAFCASLLLGVPGQVSQAQASESTDTAESFENISPYNQLVTVQAGPFRPASIALSNGSYAFNYGTESLDSYMVEVGWSARVFKLIGSWSFEENIAFSSFTGALTTVQNSVSGTQSLSAYMMGLDTRAMWAMDWFPWSSLIPFVDGGYQRTFYYQSGSSDLESAQGSVGNLVVGAGLRLWLNRTSSMSGDHVNRFAAFPFFLTAKVNHIFPIDSGLNLSSTDIMAGLSVGL